MVASIRYYFDDDVTAAAIIKLKFIDSYLKVSNISSCSFIMEIIAIVIVKEWLI